MTRKKLPEDSSLFVDSVRAVDNTETVGYLGDAVMIEALLRNVMGECMDILSKAGSQGGKMNRIKAACRQVGDILLGLSKHYSPVRNWNQPGAIDEYCAKHLGSAESNPRDRMEHAVLKVIMEVMEVARYAEIPGVLKEQWQWQVNEIMHRYTYFFMGVPPAAYSLL